MKKLLSIMLAVLMLIPAAAAGTAMISADESAKILYVKSGSTGDGSSEAKAFGDVLEAVTAAAALTEDAEVVVVGTVGLDLSATFDEPEHSNKITLRGKDADAKLSVITAGKVWNIGGKFEVRDIHIEVATPGKAFVFTTQFHDVTFGYGIKVTNTAGNPDNNALLSVRCVGTNNTRNFNEDKGVFEGDSTIIIKSGRYEDIVAFAHNGAKGNLEGTARLYIGQNVIVNNLTVCRNAKYTVTNAEIYIDGAIIRRHAGMHDKSVSGIGDALSGATGNLKVVVTKNTDVNSGWDHGSPASTLFQGLSGCTTSLADAEAHLGRVNAILEIEASVFSTVTSSDKVRVSTFDEVKSVADGTAIPADIKAIVEIGTPDENYGDDPVTPPVDTTAPAETDKAPETTKAPTTTKAPATTTKAPETTAAPGTSADTAAAPADNGGNSAIWIIVGVGAACVVAVAVIIVIKKKKAK
jgi:hypothetical protein